MLPFGFKFKTVSSSDCINIVLTQKMPPTVLSGVFQDSCILDFLVLSLADLRSDEVNFPVQMLNLF